MKDKEKTAVKITDELARTRKQITESGETETQREWADEILRTMVEGTASVTGDDFFRSLVRNLASALQVRYAFVSEFAVSNTRVRTLAFWTGEGFLDNFEYDLANTPCEQVLRGETRQYPKGVQALFPRDKDLVKLGAESYLAIPLVSPLGNVLGHLAIIDNKPMRAKPRDMPVLKIFASRATAELERKRAESLLQQYSERLEELVEERTTQLRRAEERQRVLLEINNAIIAKLERESLFQAVTEALRKVLNFDRASITLYDAVRDALKVYVLASPSPSSSVLPVGAEMPRQGSRLGWVIEHKQPVRIRDFREEPGLAPEDRLAEEGFRSAVIVPLIAKGSAVGTLNLGSKVPDRYSDDDTEFLEEVATQIALAVENLKAYEEIAQLKARLEQENFYLQEEIKTQHNFEEVVGQSSAIKRVLKAVETVAPTDANVLILGETGTGKELVARAVHNLSPRKDMALVKVNCAALPSGLIESELLGHEKGAFTGAMSRKIGRFELANGGTIFLDEIGDLPLELQAKLLRVLQEGEFERVGASQTIKVDVRVIAATNRDLERAMHEGRFRQDLFYRLNVFPIRLPSIRERVEDIPLLARYFAIKYGTKLGRKIETIPQKTMDFMLAYSRPGNIRELENIIERAVILSKGPILEIESELLSSSHFTHQKEKEPLTLEEIERAHIVKTMKETRWVIEGPKGAAKILNLHPNTLRSRMQKLGIKRDSHEIS